MKWKKPHMIISLFVLLLSACNKESETFVYFTTSEHVTDVLITCLKDNEVEYKLDEEQNIVVNEADSNKAIARCS